MFLRDKKQCSGAGEESEIIDVSVFPAFGAIVFFLLGNTCRVLILEATQMSGAAFTQEWRTGHTLFRDVIEVNYLTTEKTVDSQQNFF